MCYEFFYKESRQRDLNRPRFRHESLSRSFVFNPHKSIFCNFRFDLSITFLCRQKNIVSYYENKVVCNIAIVYRNVRDMFPFNFRRAHLRDCLELLKDLVPSPPEHQKATTLALLQSAQQYIKVHFIYNNSSN